MVVLDVVEVSCKNCVRKHLFNPRNKRNSFVRRRGEKDIAFQIKRKLNLVEMYVTTFLLSHDDFLSLVFFFRDEKDAKTKCGGEWGSVVTFD